MKFLKALIILFVISTFAVSAKDNFEGMASYYADMFVGKTTANGDKYSHNKMTCAHRSLPFGTLLKVTNLNNNKSVVVTVNDRGPYAKGRVVDLSKSAAESINMVKSGVAKVLVEVLDSDGNSYSIDEEADLSDDMTPETINGNCSETKDLSGIF
ncbi:MAG: septal ring lytic transglycosylase RlpA family protein [Chitinophagales bacterium]|nr:septal ring lytic transglycosylase RlpA family protein [Chitinophagales bacterium]